jgi:hypothetical protein
MKTITTYEDLITDIIDSKVTMVTDESFFTPLNNFDKINSLEGDIVECGVWRGGYCIFLSHLFPDKKIWVCDSFEGFQPLYNAKYEYDRERHIPEFTHGANGPLGISLEEVKSNFKQYGLADEFDTRIKFLKGFVKDTLPTSGIEKISLLRIDVDAYSATLEVLDELYPKVVKGGFIIFDDAPLYEASTAMRDYFKRENIQPKLRHRITGEIFECTYDNMVDVMSYQNLMTAGCYLIKE